MERLNPTEAGINVEAASTDGECPLLNVAFRLYPNRRQGQIHITIGLIQHEAEEIVREHFEEHRQTGPNSGVVEKVDDYEYPETARYDLLAALGLEV